MLMKTQTTFLITILIVITLTTFASAGVGIKWDRESALAASGDTACLTYGVYNPWPEDTYVEVGISEELQEVLITQDTEATLIPAHTSSGDSIPVEFQVKTFRQIPIITHFLSGSNHQQLQLVH